MNTLINFEKNFTKIQKNFFFLFIKKKANI